MTTIRNIITAIVTFFRNLFSRRTLALAGPAAVESQVMHKPKELSTWQKRRIALRALLGRTDGGGKHYGSKRAFANHRNGSGKRSGNG